MKKQKTGRVPGVVPSQSRSFTAVKEIVPATGYMDVDADCGSWSHVSSASNNTASVAHTSKGKSKAIDYDSPLTDVDEDASVGKKRKKGGVTIHSNPYLLFLLTYDSFCFFHVLPYSITTSHPSLSSFVLVFPFLKLVCAP